MVDMVDTIAGAGMIRSAGGKWIEPISLAQIQLALGGALPSAQVIAAASSVVDQLHEMENSFLVSLKSRAFSRSMRTILEYYNIRGDDLQKLIHILAHLGYARAFFNLAVPANDDGLKQYLIGAGVMWDQILFYYDFSLWDPVRFTGGFLIGLGYSVASILEVLKDLFDFTIEAIKDPETAAKKISEFVDGIRQFSLESMAAMAKEEWAKWQKEFSQVLLDLDFDRAGFMLGKLAGDLWQILTGIRALAKLPGMTIRLARRFAVLFSKGARYLAYAAELLVELLSKLARFIDEAVTIGYRAVANFFDDTVLLLEKLQEGALVIIDRTGAMIFNIHDGGVVLEGVGFIPEGYVLAQVDKGVTVVIARVKVSFEKGLKYVKDYKASASRKVKQIKNSVKFMEEVKLAEELANKLVKEWRDTLQKAFADTNIPLNPKDLGIWIHKYLQTDLDGIVAALKGKYVAEAEIHLSAVAVVTKNVKAFALGKTPLVEFVKGWPGLAEVLGATDEKEIIEVLKRMGYANPTKSVIGGLTSDAILYSEDLKRMVSIDWGSGYGKYGLANAFRDATKAGETLSEAEKIALAKRFLTHSLREYALREAILEFMFEGWETKVIEPLYDPFHFAKKK